MDEERHYTVSGVQARYRETVLWPLTNRRRSFLHVEVMKMTHTDFDKTAASTVIPVAATLQGAAFQAATPIILALMECDEALRAEAVELFKQLSGGDLDEEQRIATTGLLAEILF